MVWGEAEMGAVFSPPSNSYGVWPPGSVWLLDVISIETFRVQGRLEKQKGSLRSRL